MLIFLRFSLIRLHWTIPPPLPSVSSHQFCFIQRFSFGRSKKTCYIMANKVQPDWNSSDAVYHTVCWRPNPNLMLSVNTVAAVDIIKARPGPQFVYVFNPITGLRSENESFPTGEQMFGMRVFVENSEHSYRSDHLYLADCNLLIVDCIMSCHSTHSFCCIAMTQQIERSSMQERGANVDRGFLVECQAIKLNSIINRNNLIQSIRKYL